MIAVQVWIRCSVPGCEAMETAMAPLLELQNGRLSIDKQSLPLPEGWRHGPWYGNAVVCPAHADRRHDRTLFDDFRRGKL